MTAVVCNGGNVLKHILQTLFDKPVIGIFLNLNEVRHLENLLLTGKTHPDISAGLNRLQSAFLHRWFSLPEF